MSDCSVVTQLRVEDAPDAFLDAACLSLLADPSVCRVKDFIKCQNIVGGANRGNKAVLGRVSLEGMPALFLIWIVSIQRNQKAYEKRSI